MEMFNVDLINRISISGAKDSVCAFRPLWVIATSEENTDTLNCRNHNHAFYELHIILGGRLEYRFDEETLSLGEYEFTIIPPHQRHKVKSHSKNIEKFTLAFEISPDSELSLALEEMFGKGLVLSEGSGFQFKRLLKLFSSKNAYKSEQIYLALCSLLFEIAGQANCSHSALLHKNELDDRVFKAKKYIEDNFDMFFSCAEVASYCRMSEKQLGRLFVKHENISLLGYIHERKLEMIKTMICDSDMSHREISEKLGFSSVQYYGKFVLRMTGLTPEALRKNLIKM